MFVIGEFVTCRLKGRDTTDQSIFGISERVVDENYHTSHTDQNIFVQHIHISNTTKPPHHHTTTKVQNTETCEFSGRMLTPPHHHHKNTAIPPHHHITTHTTTSPQSCETPNSTSSRAGCLNMFVIMSVKGS